MQSFFFIFVLLFYALLKMRFNLMKAIVQIALWQFSQGAGATIFMAV